MGKVAHSRLMKTHCNVNYSVTSFPRRLRSAHLADSPVLTVRSCAGRAVRSCPTRGQIRRWEKVSRGCAFIQRESWMALSVDVNARVLMNGEGFVYINCSLSLSVY